MKPAERNRPSTAFSFKPLVAVRMVAAMFQWQSVRWRDSDPPVDGRVITGIFPKADISEAAALSLAEGSWIKTTCT